MMMIIMMMLGKATFLKREIPMKKHGTWQSIFLGLDVLRNLLQF